MYNLYLANSSNTIIQLTMCTVQRMSQRYWNQNPIWLISHSFALYWKNKAMWTNFEMERHITKSHLKYGHLIVYSSTWKYWKMRLEIISANIFLENLIFWKASMLSFRFEYKINRSHYTDSASSILSIWMIYKTGQNRICIPIFFLFLH